MENRVDKDEEYNRNSNLYQRANRASMVDDDASGFEKPSDSHTLCLECIKYSQPIRDKSLCMNPKCKRNTQPGAIDRYLQKPGNQCHKCLTILRPEDAY